MRRFARRLILIAILVGLAAAALAFQNINLSLFGANFNRGSDSPLGLTLGLDLEGGSHLVYQARKDITVKFASPATEAQVKDALTKMGKGSATVSRDDQGNIVISQTSLTDEERDAIRQNLQDSVGPISSFEVSLDPTSEQMQGVVNIIERRVNAFGVAEPSIQLMGANRILVQLPNIDVEKAKDLIGQTATLEFKERTLDVVRDLNITNSDVVSSTLQEAEQGGGILLTVTFTAEGFAKFKDFAVRLADRTQETLASPNPVTSLDALVLSAQTDNVKSVGIASASITDKGNNTFELKLTGVNTLSDAKDIFGDSPKLVFKELYAKLDTDIGLGGKDLVRAYASTSTTTNKPIVNLQFNSRGTQIFADVTRRIAGTTSQIAIFLDNDELLSPVAREAITGGQAFIEGQDFTLDKVQTMAIQLESGRLPTPIDVVQERTVDATLGKDSLKKSLIAGLVGLGVVMLYMVIYYRIAGLVASVALTIYAILVLAVFKLWPVTLTISGVAAFILSIGMAVDANILIFERMKEELRAGRTVVSATTEGFNRAWTSIRDSNVSTFITCGILFWFGHQLGTSVIQGFALTLFVGVLISMFTAITMSRTFMRVLVSTPLAKKMSWILPLEKASSEAKSRTAGEKAS